MKNKTSKNFKWLCFLVAIISFYGFLSEAVSQPPVLSVLTVEATVYRAVKKETDSTPLVTASGYKLPVEKHYRHRILAVSRDLLKFFHFGDTVIITGTGRYDGIWFVQDVMNKRYVKTVDLLIDVGMPIGKWRGVRITGWRTFLRTYVFNI